MSAILNSHFCWHAWHAWHRWHRWHRWHAWRTSSHCILTYTKVPCYRAVRYIRATSLNTSSGIHIIQYTKVPGRRECGGGGKKKVSFLLFFLCVIKVFETRREKEPPESLFEVFIMDIRSFFSRAPPKTPASSADASQGKTPSTANAEKRQPAAPAAPAEKGAENVDAGNSGKRGSVPLFPGKGDESEQEMEMDDDLSSGSVGGASSGKRKRSLEPTKADKEFIVSDDFVEYDDGAGDDDEPMPQDKPVAAPKPKPSVPHKRKKKVAAKAKTPSRKRSSEAIAAGNPKKTKHGDTGKVDAFSQKKSAKRQLPSMSNISSMSKSTGRKTWERPNRPTVNVSSHGKSLKSTKWSAARQRSSQQSLNLRTCSISSGPISC